MYPHLRDVAALEQVRGLEELLGRDSVPLGRGEEGLDVLHQHEGRALQYSAVQCPAAQCSAVEWEADKQQSLERTSRSSRL